MPKTKNYRLARVRWGSITNVVTNGDIKALEALIDAGADINKIRKVYLSSYKGYGKLNPFRTCS